MSAQHTVPSPKNVAQLRRLARREAAKPHVHLPPLPDKRYDIAYVDPPWYYYGSAIKDAAAGKHYPLMTVERPLSFGATP